jgi:transporter family-2 protein
MPSAVASSSIPFLIAFVTGGLLTSMVYLNGQLARFGNALFASWSAHATGTLAAIVLLLVFRFSVREKIRRQAHAPAWAYFGGVAGAVTVMLTSITVNSALALSGTLALGLAGQVIFGLAADRWGLFGLPRRRPDFRDLVSLGAILTGSALIIASKSSSAL